MADAAVDDIKDLIFPLPKSKSGQNGYVVKVNRSSSASANNSPAEHEEYVADSFVPGTKTIFLKTWGCAHNNSDSEYMAGLLMKAGYKVTNKDAHLCDLHLLNSCTVKTPSETQLQNAVTAAQVPVVVAGCVSQAAPSLPWLKGVSLIGVQQIDRIVQVVEETLQGNSVRLLASKRANNKKLGGASLALPKMRKNALVEILAISTGCLNHCTYCKTKQARGDLASYPIEQLVQRAQQSFTEGVKEIWLTSEDLGAYGRDLDVTLPDLLFELVKVIPENCRMRLGMTNPPYVLDHLEELAQILNHPRVYSFLHIPIQSASDPVLSDMRREYTCDDFSKLVDYMLQNVPGITIATDVICAFPTETTDDFKETLDLISKYQFPSVFINQYYPRPGTPAAKLKRIDTAEARRRTKALTKLFHSYQPYASRVGSCVSVLVTERASDGKHLVGHTDSYQQVLLPDLPHLLGRMIRVRIASASKFSMLGEIVEDHRRNLMAFDRQKLNGLLMFLGFVVPLLVLLFWRSVDLRK